MRRTSGVNMSDVKINNRTLILNQLKKGKKSRKDIAEKIKLTPAAVTILVNEMIQDGCIRESGQIEDTMRVGRKKIFIELKKDYKYVIGVNIEPNSLSIGISNLKYEIIEYMDKEINGMSVEDIMKIIVDICMSMLWNLNISKSDVLGIGVGIVGIVDSKKGLSKRAYGLWKHEVDIQSILSKELNIPVVVENNVRALALAEMELTSHKNIENMVFIKYGPGIGSAAITNKEIYKGSYNNAGELGHMIIVPNGKECKCGQRGCLETVASIRTLKQTIKDEFTQECYPILHKLVDGNQSAINTASIIEGYDLGEVEIVKKVNQIWRYFGIGIVNMIRLYDPHKIIIYSDFFRNKSYLDKLIQEINKLAHVDNIMDKIESSVLDNRRCIGGIVLVVKELFYKTGATAIS